MFDIILIANRGEIACRIIKTAHKMGIKTIAVYSDIDKNSLHVQMADEAYCIGGNLPAESYLNIDAIINTALATNTKAIHPGYGFLSENPNFATSCINNNIIFIGPTVSAMEMMASKQLAKQLLATTKIPLTLGYHDNNQNDNHLLQEAKKIGFPVILKAANGGGGKGMRIVHTQQQFFTELNSAKREAQAYFGNDIIIIEKLLSNSRHIEVQILADNYGNIIHCFERDCSLQRRHQKIIEESPAMNLSQELRKQLTDAACQVAKAINYTGAGTVEFLIDQDNHFYFMEMNTRLQVEHPVTEMLTNLDLIEWQIKIAANEKLTLKQENIKQYGHVIECRIYAEDPVQSFLPSVGKIYYLQTPNLYNIRIDTGVTQGSEINMYYDPMIAKLIVIDNNRELALQKLNQALDNYIIFGIKTNLMFLKTICNHSKFINNQITTDFFDQEIINISTIDNNHALIFASAFEYKKFNQETDPLWRNTFAWQAYTKSYYYWYYAIGDQYYQVKIQPIDHQQLIIFINDQIFNIKIQLNSTFEPDELLINIDKQNIQIKAREYADKIYCHTTHGTIAIQKCDYQPPTTININEKLTAPMSATVIAILKAKGTQVEQGDSLMVLEAMKMEHTIYANKHGIIKDIYYELGAQVHEGAELLIVDTL